MYVCVLWTHHPYYSLVQMFFFFVSTQGNSNSQPRTDSISMTQLTYAS